MSKNKKTTRKRSIVLIISVIIAVAYSAYLCAYFGGLVSDAAGFVNTSSSLFATALITPHAILIGMGSVFGLLGFFLKANWAALVAAILYTVGTFFFLPYFMFGAPILILGFIGYANQKKLNKLSADSEKQMFANSAEYKYYDNKL